MDVKINFAVHGKAAPMLLWRWKSQALSPQPQYLLPSKIQKVHFSSVALLFILCLKRFIFQCAKDDEGEVCMINVYTSCTSGKPFMPGRRCLRSLCKKQSHDKRSPRCPDCVASAKPLPWREMFQIRCFWCFSRDCLILIAISLTFNTVSFKSKWILEFYKEEYEKGKRKFVKTSTESQRKTSSLPHQGFPFPKKTLSLVVIVVCAHQNLQPATSDKSKVEKYKLRWMKDIFST